MARSPTLAKSRCRVALTRTVRRPATPKIRILCPIFFGSWKERERENRTRSAATAGAPHTPYQCYLTRKLQLQQCSHTAPSGMNRRRDSPRSPLRGRPMVCHACLSLPFTTPAFSCGAVTFSFVRNGGQPGVTDDVVEPFDFTFFLNDLDHGRRDDGREAFQVFGYDVRLTDHSQACAPLPCEQEPCLCLKS